MAKEFTFILGGNAFAAAPVKLERKKIYGWSSLVATDRDGRICTAAYISPEDSLMIPSGAAKLATVDDNGLIIKKSDLVAFDAEGKALETVPSSFDAPIDLTRMRPNRRSGFQYMGSIRQLRTNYLVAVDVSGSITDGDLRYFFSAINRFFKYGVERIDVVTFDAQLGEPVTLFKARKEIKIGGRGGTCFQPAIDYMAEHPEYDGLIIFTDGYAPKPMVPAKLKGRLLWILRSEKEYDDHRDWMKESGRTCFIENR